MAIHPSDQPPEIRAITEILLYRKSEKAPGGVGLSTLHGLLQKSLRSASQDYVMLRDRARESLRFEAAYDIGGRGCWTPWVDFLKPPAPPTSEERKRQKTDGPIGPEYPPELSVDELRERRKARREYWVSFPELWSRDYAALVPRRSREMSSSTVYAASDLEQAFHAFGNAFITFACKIMAEDMKSRFAGLPDNGATVDELRKAGGALFNRIVPTAQIGAGLTCLGQVPSPDQAKEIASCLGRLDRLAYVLDGYLPTFSPGLDAEEAASNLRILARLTKADIAGLIEQDLRDAALVTAESRAPRRIDARSELECEFAVADLVERLKAPEDFDTQTTKEGAGNLPKAKTLTANQIIRRLDQYYGAIFATGPAGPEDATNPLALRSLPWLKLRHIRSHDRSVTLHQERTDQRPLGETLGQEETDKAMARVRGLTLETLDFNQWDRTPEDIDREADELAVWQISHRNPDTLATFQVRLAVIVLGHCLPELMRASATIGNAFRRGADRFLATWKELVQARRDEERNMVPKPRPMTPQVSVPNYAPDAPRYDDMSDPEFQTYYAEGQSRIARCVQINLPPALAEETLK